MLKINKEAHKEKVIENTEKGYSVTFRKTFSEKIDWNDNMLGSIRRSIVGWNGIVDTDGEPIIFNEENQKLVFEAIVETDVEFYKKLLSEFISDSVSEKN